MLDYEANLELLTIEGHTAIELARSCGTPESVKCVDYMHKVLGKRMIK